MKYRGEAIGKLLEGLDSIVAGHAKRTMEDVHNKEKKSEGKQPVDSTQESGYELEVKMSNEPEEGEEEGKKVVSGGAAIPPLPEIEGEGEPETPAPKSTSESEMEEVKKQMMDRLASKPKAVRRNIA